MRYYRRGLFAAINVGLAYGKGQKIPTWLDNKEYASVVDRLLHNSDITRLAKFASCKFFIHL
jgi:NAD dependent epimerase/dehydratase family enzyme